MGMRIQVKSVFVVPSFLCGEFNLFTKGSEWGVFGTIDYQASPDPAQTDNPYYKIIVFPHFTLVSVDNQYK